MRKQFFRALAIPEVQQRRPFSENTIPSRARLVFLLQIFQVIVVVGKSRRGVFRLPGVTQSYGDFASLVGHHIRWILWVNLVEAACSDSKIGTSRQQYENANKPGERELWASAFGFTGGRDHFW